MPCRSQFLEALSEDLEELIAAKLGDPAYDPHGDPIPSRELTIPADESRSLYALDPGQKGTFVRISDSDPEMLRFLSDRGIAPGAEFEVINMPAGDVAPARAAITAEGTL